MRQGLSPTPRWRVAVIASVTVSCAAVVPAAAATFQSRIVYEKVPATLNGLDFRNKEWWPAPVVEIEVRSADLKQVLARGRTDDRGEIRITVPDGLKEIGVVAWARMGQIEVRDPADKRLHGAAWRPLDPEQYWTLRITDQGRFSGPFNVLAMMRQANRLLERIEPGLRPDERKLTVFWSPENKDGAYYRPSAQEVYLKGFREEDSDEFDDGVVLHEYGHHLVRQFSSFASPGGTHIIGNGERLDPRLAWDEALATFFAQAVLGTSHSIDTHTPGKGSGLDLDENIAEWERTPGYWSEQTVGSTLWDLYAATGLEGDYLGLGLAPIWRVLRGYFPRQAWPYLITLADGLIEEDSRLQSGVTGLLAQRRIDYRFGVQPPVQAPFPRLIASGAPVSGTIDTSRSRRINRFESADYYLIRPAREGAVEIGLRVAGASPDADTAGETNAAILLFDAAGKLLAVAEEQQGAGSVERLARTLPPGAYVIGVVCYRPTNSGPIYGSARYELTVRHP